MILHPGYRALTLLAIFFAGIKVGVSQVIPTIFGTSPLKNDSSSLYDAFNAYVVANTNQEDRALEAILTEMARVRRYGFSVGELERAKSNMLTRWDKIYKERDKKSNDRFISEYANHYLENEAIPSVDEEYELVKQLLPTIGLRDFNEKMESWFIDRNQVMLIRGPESVDVKHLDEEEIIMKRPARFALLLVCVPPAVLGVLSPASLPAERVTMEWRFDAEGDLRGWTLGGHIRDAKVVGGALLGETSDWDPILLGPVFEVAARPTQRVEI